MTKNINDSYHVPSERMSYSKASPGAYRAMSSFGRYAESESTLPKSLLELVKMRSSQINGCGYCLDMHSKDARANGESEQRIYLLDAWKEAPFYTEAERAALAWTEAVTLVSESHVPDEVYEEVRKYFTKKEIVDLTMAIIAINGWNRLSIAFRTRVGEYKPGDRK